MLLLATFGVSAAPKKSINFENNSIFNFVAQDCQWNVNDGKLNTSGTDGDHWLYLGEPGKGWQDLSVSFKVTVTATNTSDHNFRIQMKEGGSGNHETFYRAVTWPAAGSGNFIESYTVGAGFNSSNYTNAFTGFEIGTAYTVKSIVKNNMLSIFINGIKIVETSVSGIGSDPGRICMTFWNCAVSIDDLVMTNEANSSVIYQNDFESPDDTLIFQPANCQWIHDGAVMKSTGAGEKVIWMGEPGKGWDNYFVEFSFKITEFSDTDYNVGLMMREGATGNYMAQLRGTNWTHAGSGNFVSIYRGASEYASADYLFPFTGLELNQSYTVKYVIDGDSSKLYLDGELLLDITDDTLASGRARISAGNCNIELSQVKISDLSIDPVDIDYSFDFSDADILPLVADEGWEIKNGALTTKNNVGEKYIWSNDTTLPWTDYGYQMDVTFNDSSSDDYQMNLFIRESGGGHNYMAGLRCKDWLHAGSGNFLEIYQSGAGDSTVYLTPFTGFEKGKTYKIAFVAEGNKQSFYIDGKKLLEVIDTGGKYANGRLGISASNCSITIDNMRIFDPAHAPVLVYDPPLETGINYSFDMSDSNILPLLPDEGWEIKDGVLKTKSNVGEKYVWSDDTTLPWTDYGYQMDVTFIDSSSDDYQMNLFIRESGEGRNYMAGLRCKDWLHAGSGNFLEIYQSGTGDSTAYLSPFTGFEKGKAYSIAFVAEGNKQYFFIDGKKILEITDTSGKYAAGRLGWSASNCNVTVDNVKIFDPAHAPELIKGQTGQEISPKKGINFSFDMSSTNISPLVPDSGWEIKDGVLRTKSNIGECYVWGDESTQSWTDYSIEMDITFGESSMDDGQFNIFMRESGENKNYPVALRTKDWKHSPTGNFIDLYQSGTGDSSVYLTPFGGFEKGKKYKVRVEVTGNRQLVFVNNTLILNVKDTDNKYKSGRIGFSAFNIHTEIDNIRIFDPENSPYKGENHATGDLLPLMALFIAFCGAGGVCLTIQFASLKDSAGD